ATQVQPYRLHRDHRRRDVLPGGPTPVRRIRRTHLPGRLPDAGAVLGKGAGTAAGQRDPDADLLTSAAGDRRNDGDLAAVRGRRVESGGEPDVLLADVDVDEPAHLAAVVEHARL